MAELTLQSVHEAFTELKSVVDKGLDKKGDALDMEKLKKVETALDKYEVKNQKLVLKMKAEETQNLELKSRLNQLEKEISRIPHGSGKKDAKSLEMKAFEFALVNSTGTAVPEEYKAYLRTDVVAQGGALVAPAEMEMEIQKNITEISPIRSIARVRVTSGKSRYFPTRITLQTGSGTGEGEAITESTSTYGGITIEVRKMTVQVPITNEDLEDSAFEMQSEITSDANEDFAQREGDWSVNGAGPKQFEGILTNSTISGITSTVTAGFGADDILEITGELKTGYNPVFLFNRKTLSYIRRFKSGVSDYLWQPGIAQGAPANLNGDSYLLFPDVPDVGSSAKPVIYGDFRRGYGILDRTGMRVTRDDFTLAGNDKVRFVYIRRVGGGVLVPESIKVLTCGA